MTMPGGPRKWDGTSFVTKQAIRRREMREAKKEAGLCIVPNCGSKAFRSWQKCAKHVTSPKKNAAATERRP
jgi:hypothetical protein